MFSHTEKALMLAEAVKGLPADPPGMSLKSAIAMQAWNPCRPAG